MRIKIRRAKAAEITLIKEISIKAVWERFSDEQRRELDRETWSRRMGELFDMMVKKDSHRVFVAKDDNQAFLGYAWIGEGSNPMTGTNHGYIYDIFVKEEQRRKGIGMRLMEKAEQYCRETGYHEMLLMVSVNNHPAQRLYAKQGFKAEQTYMLKRLT